MKSTADRHFEAFLGALVIAMVMVIVAMLVWFNS